MINSLAVTQSGNFNPMQQPEYLVNQMQYLLEPQQIERQILQVIHTSNNGQTILKGIALELGNLFKADFGVIVAFEENYQVAQIGCWSNLDVVNLESELQRQLTLHTLPGTTLAINNLENHQFASELN